MCRYSGLFAAGVVVLVLAAVACSIGYIAPFWDVYRYAYTKEPQQLGIQYQGSISIWSRGLWGYCFSKNSCRWYFESGFEDEKRLPVWHKGAQGLFGIGLLILLVALIIGLVHPLCRYRCNESSSLNCTLGGLCITAGVLIGIAIGLYGGYYYNYYNSYNSVIFYWAFYVAILGAVAAVAASIVFFCAGRRARYYTGYHLTI